MQNDRPIQNAALQAAIDEVKEILHQYGFAGACMLISADEAAFVYGMHAPWSAIRSAPETELGWRFRAKTKEDGRAVTQDRVEAALHTICQLSDFGVQTFSYMEDLKKLMRGYGINFDHVSFGGEPLQRITLAANEEVQLQKPGRPG